MAKLKVLAGDMKPGAFFYTIPGAIGEEAVADAFEADPDSVRELFKGRMPRGVGRTTWFVATLASGGKVLVQTDPGTFARFMADLGKGPVSRDFVAAKKAENNRMAFLFIVLFIVALVIAGRFFQGWRAFVLATAATMIGIVAYAVIRDRLKGRA